VALDLLNRIRNLRYRLGLGVRVRRLWNMPAIWRATRLLALEPKSVLFVTPLLRAREIKLATALRGIGWKVVLIYVQTTPIKPEENFDMAIQVRTEGEAHVYAKMVGPRVCHVFTGAVDPLLMRFCRDKPGPVVVDMNDVFCGSLFDYLHERFGPTRECLSLADGLCARDLQVKSAQRLEGFPLPRRKILFPEYSWRDGPRAPGAAAKGDPSEVHVVSVGTICLESQGMYDSGYLRLAEMLAEQRIHFHIYPHWFYRKSAGSVFNFDLRKDFADYFRLAERTPYLHIHDSLSLDELARALPQYDFGIVSGGCEALGQKLQMLKQEYMRTCYSGRISDYLDARLPVLINREVGFNHWLLRRQGIAVELERVLRPGFREHLLDLKASRNMAANMERAAKKMSLDVNIGRLAALYEKVVADTAPDWQRFSYAVARFKSVPLLGRYFRLAEAELQQSGSRARRAIAAQQELLRRQQGEVEKLQWNLDQVVLSGVDTAGGRMVQPEAAPGNAAPKRARSVAQTKLNLEVEFGPQWADQLRGLLNWPEIQNRAEQSTGMPELMEMIRLFGAGSGATSDPSTCWQVLGFKNFNELLSHGYASFKRTIGLSYFNFLVQAGDPQIAFLEAELDAETRERCARAADALPDDPEFTWHDQRAYRYFVLMLWEFARKRDRDRLLDRLEEPAEGKPLVVPAAGRVASQDLANSVLEYYAMTEVVNMAECKRTLEIGGGYGRDAFVILKLNPHIQHTVVDIPPALWIAQRYLSSVFPERKIFTVRDFRSYDEVAEEMEAASIVFLLPHQLDLLPDRRFDLSMNISSFGEMHQAQINSYFRTLERLTRGHFYMKQWKMSQNAFDKLSLSEKSYPVPAEWRKIYSRDCAVQTAFFESLYRAG
jgi:putative sugar O-methyltransferase